MKKKIALFLMFLSIVVIALNWQSHPLMGEWISEKGDVVGMVSDPNAPYTVMFTEDEMQILDKQIKINYILKNENENLIYLEAKDSAQRLQVRKLKDGNIRFSFPSIGLRIYKRI